MSFDQIYVLAVLLGALTLFATERIPLGVTGLGVIAALGLAGVLDPNRALSAFASPTLVIVGSLYVVSAGLLRTGVVARLGERLLRRCEGSEVRLLLTAMLAAMVLSTLLNNTSVVVLMLPLLLGAAKNLGIAPSRLLMPVSFAAILGGTMTLIGTSTNVLVADLAQKQLPSMEPLGFFEFAPVGAGYAVLGMVYLWLIGR
ncbi:MAG: SLC13 family permease, partial [Planctomycetota bacterium]|nr:SLC13 family permease [Planctomycetota bacterium]